MPVAIALVLVGLLHLGPIDPASETFRLSRRSRIETYQLAEIIAGEVPTCPLPAKVAIAQVYHNRLDSGIQGGWFGRGSPTPTDLAVALYWRYWPDLVDGALYAVNRDDVSRMPWLRELVVAWDCPGGISLLVWR